jgi:aspartate kinase
MKFGGALMSKATGIVKVSELIRDYCNEPLVVVVSALGKTTNALEKLHDSAQSDKGIEDDFDKLKQYHVQIVKDIGFPDEEKILAGLDNILIALYAALNKPYNNRYEAYDSIVSFGEEMSSYIVFHYLTYKEIPVTLFNAKNLIATNSNYTDAVVDWEITAKNIISKVSPIIESGKIVVTQGFTGGDMKGMPTTLGREGSDFTAAILANVLNADEVTIWKNVPGLMNADPARYNDAIKIDNISYYEAIELAYYGASVIHPKTIQPLKQKKIPLFVRSYNDPSQKPTSITDDVNHDNLIPSIIVKDNQILLSISTKNLSFIAEENLKQIFDAFSRNKIHVNMMQNSAVSFSVCFNEDSIKLQSLISELRNSFSIRYNTGLQLITIRQYNDNLIKSIVGRKEVILVQKSRITVQLLIKDNAIIR